MTNTHIRRVDRQVRFERQYENRQSFQATTQVARERTGGDRFGAAEIKHLDIAGPVLGGFVDELPVGVEGTTTQAIRTMPHIGFGVTGTQSGNVWFAQVTAVISGVWRHASHPAD
ncbi:MAG TPA: hypothetical protein VJT31_21120 [Rugosimonospora sp.]|nr:hypothetical protein [Rugosimonospora sp.]